MNKEGYQEVLLTKRATGFTLLEVMVAMAIIAITLTAVLGSQSQSVSFATEAKFSTTAALLAQSKMAEIEAQDPEYLTSDSGDFGEDFPDYTWEANVRDVFLDEPENASDHLKQIDLTVSWGEGERYQYRLRRYRFSPQTE
jgi:general secretion pathway protein I